MLVLGAVHPTLTRQLRQAASYRYTIVSVQAWSAVVTTIRQRPVEIAVVDPALEGPVRAREIERLRVLFPSLPLVLYSRLTPDLPQVLLRLGQLGVRTVLLAGHEDHPARMREALTEEGTRILSRQLLGEMGDLLEDLPGELRWVIEAIVRAPAEFQTVQELADRARMDRRTCARWFARVNLPPPSTMLTVLRALYAHRLLQDPGFTVEDVAARLGYLRARSLTRSIKEIFGMTPAEIRLSLSADDALSLVRRRFFKARGSERDLRIS
jgi:AraC-like DNA-binding protein